MEKDTEENRYNEGEYARAKHRADQSKANYDNLMERSYLSPKSAEKKMDAYRSKNGNEALYEKLGETSRKPMFGRRPGSILSKDGYTPGADDRRTDSQIARQSLPDAVRNHHRDSERLAAAERARGGGLTPQGGGGTPPPAQAPKPNLSAAPSNAPAPSVSKAPKPDLGIAGQQTPTMPVNKAPKPDLSAAKSPTAAPVRGKSREPDLER